MQSGVIRGHIRNELSLNIQHCQIIALNGCLLILPASFFAHRKFNIQHSTFNINHHESKLEIRHQFRHHCPHRRSQLLLHAELQVIASEHELHESNESYLFKGHIRVIREIRVQLNICSKDLFVSFEKFVFS